MSSHTPLWQVLQLRGTIFSADINALDLPSLWRQIVKEDPEEEQIRPRQGLSQLTGPFGDWQLQVAGLPDRIHLVISSDLEEYRERNQIGPSLSVGLEAIQRLIEGWLPEISNIARLAFGTLVSYPVESRQEGYSELSNFLEGSVRIDPKNSSDFSYQINRPRESIVTPPLVINRLSKWSVTSQTSLHVRLSPGTPAASVDMTNEGHTVRLELDISTAADYSGNLDRDHLAELFQELAQLAAEITTNGDTT